MNQSIRLIVTLALIAALATGLLAVVNTITAPLIEEGARERLQAALGEVIDADNFEEVTDEDLDLTYYEASKSGELVGYVFEIAAKGYGTQPIMMIVGLDTDVAVTGVKVLSHSETPGLGDRPFAQNKLEEFIGQNLEEGVDFDIVSGATSSSLGLLSGVNEAVTNLGKILGLIVEIDFSIVPDGTYQGKGRGFGGDIEVEVTIKNGELVELNILNHSETPGISDPAFERIPQRMIDEQYLEVDAISGATATTNGIKLAVRNALAEFFGGEVEQPIVLSEVANGTYRGEGIGFFNAPVSLEVTVRNGKITAINYLDFSSQTDDYAAIAKPAMEEKLVGSDTLDVDTNTGATGTSNGIIDAIKNALRTEPIVNLSDVMNGTYRGEGRGFKSDIVVEVVVKDGVITSLEVISEDDSEDYAPKGITHMKDVLVNSDTLDVDLTSGATRTSEGILAAVKNALSSDPMIVLSEVKNGTYQGEGIGFFNSPVTLEVTVTNGKITAINYLDFSSQTDDYAAIAKPAMEEKLVGSDTLDVDTNTGATGTSNGILAAVKNALMSGLQ